MNLLGIANLMCLPALVITLILKAVPSQIGWAIVEIIRIPMRLSLLWVPYLALQIKIYTAALTPI